MTLPFKQNEIYLGLAEISGLMRIVNQTLEFEYKVKDTTLGILDSSIKSCRIPLHIIDSIEVEKKWFSGKFELTFNRIPDLHNPFQLEGNSLKLSVKKRDLEKARSFRSTLMVEIMEREMNQTDDENTRKEQKPFTQRKTNQEKPKRSRPGRQTGDGGLENMLREE